MTTARTITLLYADADHAVGDWAQAQLHHAGYTIARRAPAKGDIVVAVIHAPKPDATVLMQVYSAFDLSLHVVPILIGDSFEKLPRALEHLAFISPDDADGLRDAVARAASPDARVPLKVLTPAASRGNSRIGLGITLIALVIFGMGLYGVGVLGIQAPRDEYDLVETEIALTRDVLAGPELLFFSTWIPRSTEDALNYEATLSQLPTAYRPLMALTVTATAQGTFTAATATPVFVPTASPTASN